MTHRLIDGELLLTQIFWAGDDGGNASVCIYCSWREIQPSLICISQQDPVHGGIVDVGTEFFDLVHPLENADVSASSDEITEIFGTPTISYHKANTIAKDDLKQSCKIASKEDPIIACNSEVNAASTETEDEEVDQSKVLVITILKSMVAGTPSVDFQSDSWFDPSGSIADYRFEFSVVEELFDVILTAFDCPHRNLDKELLMELKSVWEQCIETVRKFRVQKALSVLVWLPAMWMQVIGCPAIVRTQEELLHLLLDTVISMEEFTEAAVVQELVKQSFRPKFSKWVAFHMFSSTKYLDEYLLDISEPLNWNSFLLESTVDNKSVVQYTHLHKTSRGNYAVVEPRENLELKVVGFNLTYKNIIPVALKWTSQTWFPRDYANKVFSYMQEQLKRQREVSPDKKYCFFGHVCSEESVIGMSKFGMSPFVGFQNRNSCGRGMYFFKIELDEMLSFDQLNLGAGTDEQQKQFQGFVYALSRGFMTGKISALSVAVLMFLVEESAVNAFDTLSNALPMRNCSCTSIIENIEPLQEIESIILQKANTTVSTKDTIRAISMINSATDTEKFNAFSLVAGIVDFSQLPSGVLSAHTSDNMLCLPPDVIESWADNEEFCKWKAMMINTPIAAYRRIHLFFNFSGDFCRASSALPVTNRNNAFLEWGKSKIDEKFQTIPALEYVFFSLDALSNLLEKSHSVSVSFVESKQFNTMTSGQREVCLLKKEEGLSTVMNEQWVHNQNI